MDTYPNHSMRAAKRALFALLSLLLAASLACNLPFFTPRGQETPQPTAVVRPEEGGVEPSPPTVVESWPLPGGTVALQEGFSLTFDQEMDRSSVEGAVRITPSFSGRFDWQDDYTVRFIPDQPFPINTQISVTVAQTARGLAGKTLLRPIELNFQTPGEFRIAERLPRPDAQGIDPSTAITLTFNRPVVSLGEAEESAPQAFQLDPPVEGSGRWLNTSTYIYYPYPALAGGVEYTVIVNPELTSLEGVGLSTGESLDWSFRTAEPALINVVPSPESTLNLDGAITLGFNQPMNKAHFQENVRLRDSSGNTIPVNFSWDDRDSLVSITPQQLLERGSFYTLEVGRLLSQGGTPLASSYQLSYRSVGNMAVVETSPRDGQVLETAGASISVRFSAPLAERQNLDALVQVDPRPGYMFINQDQDRRILRISGNFLSGTSYTYTLSADIEDRWGQRLGQDVRVSFTTGDSQPALYVPMTWPANKAIFALPDETTIPAYVTNLTGVEITRARLSLREFFDALDIILDTSAFDPEDVWRQELSVPVNVSTPVNLQVSRSGETLQPGIYAIHYDAPQQVRQGDSGDFRLIVSSVQMTLKESREELLVWATDLVNGRVVADRPVVVYNTKGDVLGRGRTDGDGVARVALPVTRESFSRLIAVLGESGEDDFSVAVTMWNNGISPYNFGLPAVIDPPDIQTYLYTDRPIYQPGQEVFFRAVLRQADDARYQPVQIQDAVFKLYGDYVPEISQVPLLDSQKLAVSVYGTAHGVFTLPENAPPGIYSISIEGYSDARVEFQVAEYRKPEIDVQVQFAQPEYLLGQDLHADIYSRYFYGETASNVKVSWSLFAREEFIGLPDGYQTGLLDSSWLSLDWWMAPAEIGQFISSGEGLTGPDGHLPITILGSDLLSRLTERRTVRLVLEATLFDESGLPVSRRADTLLHPASFYIGVRSEGWGSQVGTPVRFDILSADRDAAPQPGKELRAEFDRIEWVQDWDAIQAGEYAYKEEITPVASVDFFTGADGRARLEFNPEQPGTYRLQVSGDGAITQALVWVGGPGSAPWPRLPNQQLRLETDSAHYRVGESAQVFIPNPFPVGALALITVERRGILRSQVLTLTGSSTTLELPLEAVYAPNIYVSVILLGKGDRGQPDFRAGYAELSVDPEFMQLDVQISAQKTAFEPRETASFEILVRDASGNPIQGEFSLAAVDKALLALADPNAKDILSAFYGRQPLAIWTSMSLAAYSGRLVLEPPARGGGGGGGFTLQSLDARADFKDTAYWIGSFETDAGGRAVIDFPLPDNLTTWVVTVRGLTRDTRVGEAVAEIVVNKALLIRPVTPRFLVAGDRVQLGAVVNNNSAEALDVIVHLGAAGVRLEEPALAAQAVQVPAGGRQRVNWWVTVQDALEADLLFSVQGGGLSDAATPQQGKIPIQRYVSPQTFATSGILPAGGRWLEVVSLPRSYTPGGGELRVELTPTLIGIVFSSLDVVRSFPGGFSEAYISALQSNLAAYELLKAGNYASPDLSARLPQAIRADLNRLISLQRADGGWGWTGWHESDLLLTSYSVLVLEKARSQGFLVDQDVLSRALDFVKGGLYVPSMTLETWQLDRLAFSYFVLNQNDRSRINPVDLLALSERLNPWAQAFLAMALKEVDSQAASQLLSDLAGNAIRTASGVHWQERESSWHNLYNPLATSAVVVQALADLDPASPLLADAVRYLVAHRRAGGGWMSSYDTGWILAALAKTARATGDVQADFAYSAALNAEPLVSGHAAGLENLNPQRASVPLSSLSPSGNLLQFEREDGPGRLYYRAFLEVAQPVESLPAVDSGLTVSRRYTLAGADCPLNDCPRVSRVSTQTSNPVVRVQVSITVPEDMFYLVVEDYIPAGSEIVNTRLLSSQMGVKETMEDESVTSLEQGWRWWFFGQPVVYTDRIRWVASYVPAGTYVLTYRLMPLQAGEYRVLPARAYQYYFPEVQGRSAGDILRIE